MGVLGTDRRLTWTGQPRLGRCSVVPRPRLPSMAELAVDLQPQHRSRCQQPYLRIPYNGSRSRSAALVRDE